MRKFRIALMLSLAATLLFGVTQAFAEEKTHTADEFRPACETGFKYKHSPLLNPKAMKDIIVNPNAIYGFSPDPKSVRLGEYADYDWSEALLVYKSRQERIAYHEKDAVLRDMIISLSTQGRSTEEIARAVSAKRNEIRLEANADDPVKLAKVKKSNFDTYGNENGPDADFLYKKYGSWETVMEKALSTNLGMDACLGLYDDYYLEYVASGQAEAVSPDDEDKLDSWGENRPKDIVWAEYEDVFENTKYYEQNDGDVIWPENNGFWGESFAYTLLPMTKIDRYGSDYGTFVSLYGKPYEAYSLAPGSKYKPYSIFIVKKPIAVEAGSVYPWFDEEGGATQCLLPVPIKDLLEAGYIERIAYVEK